MSGPRDTQRLRVYRVTWALAPSTATVTLEQARELVDRALLAYGEAPIARVGDGRRRRTACGGYDSVSLPRWSRTAAVVLHEAAHVLLHRRGLHGLGAAADHGPEFARIYADLLRRFSGLPEREVTAAFRVERVRLARCDRAPAMLPATASKRLAAIRAERSALAKRIADLRAEESALYAVARTNLSA